MNKTLRYSLTLALGFALLSACSSGTKAGQTVDVRAKEYAFEPAALDVKAGRVEFDVSNVGKEEHEFEIFDSAGKLVDEVEDIAPGLSRTLSADLAAGTYSYVCKLPGHEEKGMKGTLNVA